MTFQSTQHCLFCCLLLLLTIACGNPKGESVNSAKKQPNFFLFLADDLSYDDLGITGNPYVETSTIDAFAKTAISFENMYTPSAMCAPSRSALLTGLYPHKNGCHMNHGRIYDTVKSLPNYLRDLGYQVALVGKRHIKPKENFPFDYLEYDDLKDYLAKVTKPLCVIYASNEPHGPHRESEQSIENTILPAKWLGTESTKEKLLGYYADIAALEDEFKGFLKSIEKNALTENSITIFTSDHGYEYFAKWSCYEAGLKVPFFMKTHNIKFNKEKVATLTSFVDIVPTFIELAGGIPPKELDGKSFLPVLKGNQEFIHKYIYGAHTTRGIYSGKAYPIRSITNGKWKYIHNLNSDGKFQNILTNGWNFDPTPITGSWAEWLAVLKNNKVVGKWAKWYQKRPAEELYNLEEDPNEMVNLADNTIHKEIKSYLKSELTRWMQNQKDTGMEAEMAVPLKARDSKKIPN